MRRASLLAAFAAFLALGAAVAQEGGVGASHPLSPEGRPRAEGNSPSYPEDALNLTLTCRIVPRDGAQNVWQERAESLIYPDKSLQLRMVGEDIVIVVVLTPSRSSKDEAAFVVKTIGQIWVKAEDSSLNYYSSLYFIPLRLGEEALYYPLGSKGEGKDVVELILRMDRPARTKK